MQNMAVKPDIDIKLLFLHNALSRIPPRLSITFYYKQDYGGQYQECQELAVSTDVRNFGPSKPLQLAA